MIVAPTVSAAGTPRGELLDRWNRVHWMLGETVAEFAKIDPRSDERAKDYPEADARETASVEHIHRLEKLNAVLAELDQIRVAITAQDEPQ